MYSDINYNPASTSNTARTRISPKGSALITGASSGIGAVYADRLAKRGYDLILVARNQERLFNLAKRIGDETGRIVEAVGADLNNKSELAMVEQILRTDERVSVLVNNAGIGETASLVNSDIVKLDRMIDLNVTAVVRLTYAAVPAFLKRGAGTIINLASALGIAPELFNGVYGATKAFVLAFSLSLQKELAESDIRVQAVLPGAISTPFWDGAGMPVTQLPESFVMNADDMVDAALAGLDMGEKVTIPSLPDIREWEDYEAMRQKMIPHLSSNCPASRYGFALPQTLEVAVPFLLHGFAE